MVWLSRHNNSLIKVFEKRAQYNLKLNSQKCSFLRKEVTYLGHLITHEGVEPGPSKLEVIKNYLILLKLLPH